MNRKRAEPSWQTYGEVAGPKLELQKKKKKKFQEKIMKSFRVVKILNSVPNAIDVLKQKLKYTIL